MVRLAQFRAGPVMVRLAQLRAGPANGSLGTVQRRTRKWFAWCVWKKWFKGMIYNAWCVWRKDYCTFERLCPLHRGVLKDMVGGASVHNRTVQYFADHIDILITYRDWRKGSIGKRPIEGRPQLEWANCTNQEAVLEAHLEEAPTFAFLCFCRFYVFFHPQPNPQRKRKDR